MLQEPGTSYLHRERIAQKIIYSIFSTRRIRKIPLLEPISSLF